MDYTFYFRVARGALTLWNKDIDGSYTTFCKGCLQPVKKAIIFTGSVFHVKSLACPGNGFFKGSCRMALLFSPAFCDETSPTGSYELFAFKFGATEGYVKLTPETKVHLNYIVLVAGIVLIAGMAMCGLVYVKPNASNGKEEAQNNGTVSKKIVALGFSVMGAGIGCWGGTGYGYLGQGVGAMIGLIIGAIIARNVNDSDTK